eukprot:9486271-Pyramimonas_sp.AAC.1
MPLVHDVDVDYLHDETISNVNIVVTASNNDRCIDTKGVSLFASSSSPAASPNVVALDLVDPLESMREWASIWPHNVAYIFTNDKGEQVDARTFGGLCAAAEELAHFLLRHQGCVKVVDIQRWLFLDLKRSAHMRGPRAPGVPARAGLHQRFPGMPLGGAHTGPGVPSGPLQGGPLWPPSAQPPPASARRGRAGTLALIAQQVPVMTLHDVATRALHHARHPYLYRGPARCPGARLAACCTNVCTCHWAN